MPRKGNDTEAIAAYESALKLEPGNIAALHGAATIYTRDKLHLKAVEALEVAGQTGAGQRTGACGPWRGILYHREPGWGGGAISTSLRLKPNSASALLGLGNVYLRLGEQDRAIAVLQKAIKLSPDAFEPRFLLGSAYNRLNRYQDAVNELETAVHLGGDESEVYYHLARAYGGLGREDARRTASARFAELSKRRRGCPGETQLLQASRTSQVIAWMRGT